MAVVTTQQKVAALYTAIFNRAPDQSGLNFWTAQINAGTSFASVAAGFAQHEVFTTGIGALDNAGYVSALYTNILGSAGDTAGIAYWTARLAAGESKAAIVAEFVNGSLTIDIPALLASGGISAADAAAATIRQQTLTNKADVGIYFANTLGAASNLNAATVSTSKAGLEADPIYKASQAAIAGVDSTAASVTTAKDSIAVAAGSPDPAKALLGQTFTLTEGVDTFVGNAANDTITATNTAAKPVLGGLDSVDGGAGVDTLAIADTATVAGAQFGLPTGFTVKNVENINVTTNGGINLDVSTIAGLTAVKTVAAGTANTLVTASTTTDVTTTVTGAATTTVAGGKAVNVTASTGVTSVSGKGLTTVTVKGGGDVTIDNLENTVAATSAKGTTLTSVTLDGVNADSDIKGEGLTSVTVKGATAAANTVTITNAKVDHALTVNVDGTGYKTDGTAVQTVVADDAAKTITVNATGAKSSLALTGSIAATTVNVTGSADLTLAALASATTLNGSAATGSLTLGTLAAGTVTVSTGSGNDSLSIAATAKTTVNTGAGNDTVILTSAIAAGSSLNLGAGNDKLLVAPTGSVATSTVTDITVIDAGDGIDTVSAALINAGNAAQFKNFESLDISAAANLDVALMTGSTITGLTLTGNSAASAISNVAAGVGLTVSGDNSVGTHTINVKDAATGIADSFAITFAGEAATGATAVAPTTHAAGTVVAQGIESLTVASTGTGFVSNTLAVTDANLKTLTITGDKDFGLTFVGVNGTNGATGGAVSLIDGSSATGKLNINTTNVVADSASAGLTVKGGSANDTIVLNQKATVIAGAGDDNITSSANGGTFTGGAGKDVFNVKAAFGNVTTITDFVVGTDKLTFADHGTETFTSTKVNISAATNLSEALALAAVGDGGTNTAITWFQYGADTYVVADATTGAYNAATDVVVKLAGLVDLSTQTVADFNFAAA